MVKLEGKTAIVTGASQGIGREISLVLSRHGMNVVIAARSEDKLRALQNEITSGRGTSLAVKSDVRSVTECKGLVKQALDCYGKIDVLINNAALRVVGPIDMSDPEEITEMVKVNPPAMAACRYRAGWQAPARRAGSSSSRRGVARMGERRRAAG